MEDKLSYYAILPANVRYDNNLTPNAKLLYAEITALCNEKGYCWSSNDYFARLYKVSKISISKWISQLEQKNYIKSELIYKEGTKQILNRYIRIVKEPIKEKFNTPIKEKFKDNNTFINNTFNNKEKIYKKEKHFDDIELNDLFIEFLDLRKKLKAINSERAINSLINILVEYDDETKIKLIEQSIVNSWKSIYPLKNNNQKKKTTMELIDEM